MTITPSPPPVAAGNNNAAATNESDSSDFSDDEDENPQSEGEPDETVVVPYISLLARAKVLEQALGSPERRNSLLSSSRQGSAENNTLTDLGRKMFKKNTKSSRSFRMSFVLTAVDDGLDDLAKNITNESTERRTLIVRAALALWEHHRAAAAMRRWKEILCVSSLSLFARSEDINEKARKILYSAELMRMTIENAAAAAPMSPRAGLIHDVAIPVKFTRRDLDLLVVWARQMQAKTFPPGVDDTSIRETMKYLRFRQYQDGEALFFEGEIGEIFYFLFQGTVAVYVGSTKSQLKTVEGTRRTTRIQDKPDLKQLGKRVFAYRTGEGFGETAMFTNDAIRTASAVAVGTCEVCELPKEIYKRTLKAFHQQFFTQAQKINFIQRVSLFKDWQRIRLSTIADIIEKRKMTFGDHLLVEGTTLLTSCFFVLSGLVKLTKKIDMAPPPNGADINLSSKKPKHRIQMSIELQTLGVAEIVALEALLEPNERVTYSAVAASANVELYVLKEVDACGILGTTQSSLYQRVRDICIQERAARDARIAAARRAFREHEMLKKDMELLRSQDNFAESELAEQSALKALDAKAEETLQATNCGASPLVSAGAAPYLPHLRATNLLEFTKVPYVPLSPSSRIEHEMLNVVSSPKMLSMCAKNFVFENSSTLASDFPERLRHNFPPAPAANRSLVEKITALMTPVSPTAAKASPRSNATASPRLSARRMIKPTSETRDNQRVLEQQMKRLHDAKSHWDADRKDFALFPPPAKSITPSSTLGKVAATNVVRQTSLHQDLKATQDSARKLVEEHLRKVSQRGSEAPGQATFLHFF